MPELLLIRPEDHLVLGVRWKNFTVSGAGVATRITAGAGARIIIVFPPQHIGEESSPRQSAASDQLAIGGAVVVPAWRGVLSAPSRLEIDIAAGTQIPLTVEGVLAATIDKPIVAPPDPTGTDNTVIELPWRLVIAPRGRTSGKVICRHPAQLANPDNNRLWRTRLADPGAASGLPDAGLEIRIVDEATALSSDPTTFTAGNKPPLTRDERQRLYSITSTGLDPKPADVSRLELSALGGTLGAVGRWPTFEWDHRAVLGRDMHVRTLAKGVLYPFGHRAHFETITERIDDTDATAGGAAVLRKTSVLTIVEPVRLAPAGGRVRRIFPFRDVEITRTVFSDLNPNFDRLTTMIGGQKVATHFFPKTIPRPMRPSVKVLFPVAFTTSTGEVVRLELPLLFVDDRPEIPTLTSPEVAEQLAKDYREDEALRGITTADIDLVGMNLSGDIQEVRALKITGASLLADNLDLNRDGYRPKLAELDIGLPALRGLLGDDSRAVMRFTEDYLDSGAGDLLLEAVSPAVTVDFTKAADRSGGIAAPKFELNALSRLWGPVNQNARPDPVTKIIDATRLFPSDQASLLGIPLRQLLTQLKEPPQITYTSTNGASPDVKMQWRNVALRERVGPFVPTPNVTRFDLDVTSGPNKVTTNCTLNAFRLDLPSGPKTVLSLAFEKLQFQQQDGKAPTLLVEGITAEFSGDLALLGGLASLFSDLDSADRLLDVTPRGLALRYRLPIPVPPSVGVFVMRNMVFTIGIEVPFEPRLPISDTSMSVLVTLGFATRANPFTLSVMMFGGGGYIELALDRNGLNRFEAALEFGAFVAVDFFIARGEVHALGGVRFVLEADKSVTITGYLRIGGSVEVLGLIAVSIELCLSLAYKSATNALVGRATLVIEIDLTLWSDSVEIDSGEWEFAGGGPRAVFAADPAFLDNDLAARWKDYRAAFAPRSGMREQATSRPAEPNSGSAKSIAEVAP